MFEISPGERERTPIKQFTWHVDGLFPADLLHIFTLEKAQRFLGGVGVFYSCGNTLTKFSSLFSNFSSLSHIVAPTAEV